MLRILTSATLWLRFCCSRLILSTAIWCLRMSLQRSNLRKARPLLVALLDGDPEDSPEDLGLVLGPLLDHLLLQLGQERLSFAGRRLRLGPLQVRRGWREENI